MKTVILGGGAQGSILAAHLRNAGRDVTIVAREPRASMIERDGLRITGIADLHVHVRVVRDAAHSGSADLYVNSLKTYADSSVLRALRPRKEAIAFSVQNGILKNRVLSDVFGVSQVLGAASFTGGVGLPDGAVRMTEEGGLCLGEMDGLSSARCNELAEFLSNSGVATTVPIDISAVEWAKYALFVGQFSVALMTRQETYSFLGHTETARLVVMLNREMVALARAAGIEVARIGDCAAADIATMPLLDAIHAVMAYGAELGRRVHKHKVTGLQDLERGRPTEVDETVGHAVRLAQAYGLDLPHLRTCHAVCNAISPPAVREIDVQADTTLFY